MSPPATHSTLTLLLADEQATAEFGARLAQTLQPGARLYLSGALGAGKTTLVRAVLRALGVAGKVKSPTYALVELYKLSKLDLYHFDFYRFNDSTEWEEAGLREIFAESGNVVMVEWPERAQSLLPPADVTLTVALRTAGGPSERQVSIAANTVLGEQMMKALSGEN